MRLKGSILAASAACVLAASTALAWNRHGNELAAYLAYQGLTPAQRELFNGWLKQHPERDRLAQGCPAGFDKDLYVFMRAATWPDMVRDKADPLHATDDHPVWHYINFPVNLGSAHGPAPETTSIHAPDPKNILQALAKCEADLAAPELTDRDRAVRLSWILHLVGDLHQPLHAVSLYSEDYPKGDQGGNLFWVEAHGKPMKLHTYWDDVLGESEDTKKIAGQGELLRAKPTLTRDRFSGQLSHTGHDAWALESVELAKTEANRGGQIKGAKGREQNKGAGLSAALPPDYAERALLVAQEQIALAGYRLTDTLAAVADHAPKR